VVIGKLVVVPSAGTDMTFGNYNNISVGRNLKVGPRFAQNIELD
jgi:hypothetical protein